MRQIIDLNRSWSFEKDFNEAEINRYEMTDGVACINLPHTHELLPYNNFDEEVYQYISTYKKEFQYDLPLNKRLLLHFEGVMTYAKVYLNGNYIGDHKGGFTPFVFDITGSVKADNILTVVVDGTERVDIPPFGFVVDYLCYAGIYRDVYLEEVDNLYIENVKSKTVDVLEESIHVISKVSLQNYTKEVEAELVATLTDVDDKKVYGTKQSKITLRDKCLDHEIMLEGFEGPIELWGIDHPKLYMMTIELFVNGKKVDSRSHSIGFRKAEFTRDGFYLNKEKLILKGLNRHQSFPYNGYAMPRRIQEDDAIILKEELGLNVVRTSHYPQSSFFLDQCDAIGLLVFEEIPGWQHIGDEAWQELALTNVKEMIDRDYNHPSIILWGVRINESGDNHDFYKRTNALSHELDTSRQTGGVRCITESDFLEDVYTFNDFILGDPFDVDKRVLRPQLEVTGLEEPVPYLVTEYNGHLYPTKRFDQVTRQEEHVHRHLQVMNETALMPYTSGSIGWCAFDYNTHYQFGSSDRICYHGVMDMFRIPKYSAYAYSSQMEVQDRVVMEPVVVYGMGEKNYGGVTPITILTNVDYVDYYIGEKKFGRYYKATNKYPGLKNPPILIEGIKDVWGAGFENVIFKGYVDGVIVAEKAFVKNPIYTDIEVVADHIELTSEIADGTRIEINAIDQIGNRITYSDSVITVTVEGDAELIGPSTFPLIGGCRAVWIKTLFIKGPVMVKVADPILGYKKTINIEVK